MKILWCHEVSYLDKPVYEYQDFPERLAARGHKVEVIDFSEARRVHTDSICLCTSPADPTRAPSRGWESSATR